MDDKGVGIATFEATREDFVTYRACVSDNDVVSKTGGTFQKARILVINTQSLLSGADTSIFLKLEKAYDHGYVKYTFTAELLETSFTLRLDKVKSSLLELLTKRVARLEANPSGSRSGGFSNDVSALAYVATCKTTVAANQSVTWDNVTLVNANLATERPTGPTIRQSGTYQILVTTYFNQAGLVEVLLGESIIVRARVAAAGPVHIICTTKIAALEEIYVRPSMPLYNYGIFTAEITVIKWTN